MRERQQNGENRILFICRSPPIHASAPYPGFQKSGVAARVETDQRELVHTIVSLGAIFTCLVSPGGVLSCLARVM